MSIVKSKWLALVAAAAMAAVSVTAHAEKEMKPFILGSAGSGDVASKAADVKAALENNGFEIAGEYSPYEGAQIIVVTNEELKKAAASHNRGGYVAPQRVSITKVGDEVQVAYTNPEYMAAAYHIKKGNMAKVKSDLAAALGSVKEYGPDEGMSADDLEDYHYTFGMEYFDEPYELASYRSQKDAVEAVAKGLAQGAGGTTMVYRIDIPGTNQTVFGVGMSDDKTGNKYMDEKFIMSEIDFKPVRSTAHLPYEILVTDGNVEALHARFRIAINFPDLSMMGANSFMNIMPTPDAINEALTQAAGGEVESDI